MLSLSIIRCKTSIRTLGRTTVPVSMGIEFEQWSNYCQNCSRFFKLLSISRDSVNLLADGDWTTNLALTINFSARSLSECRSMKIPRASSSAGLISSIPLTKNVFTVLQSEIIACQFPRSSSEQFKSVFWAVFFFCFAIHYQYQMSSTKKEKENTRQKKMAFETMISLYSRDWHAFAFMTVLVISKNTQDVDFLCGDNFGKRLVSSSNQITNHTFYLKHYKRRSLGNSNSCQSNSYFQLILVHIEKTLCERMLKLSRPDLLPKILPNKM